MLNEYEVSVLQEAREVINEIGDTPKGIGWLSKLSGVRTAQHDFHRERMKSAGHPKEFIFHRNALDKINSNKVSAAIARTAQRRGHSVLNTMSSVPGSYNGSTKQYYDQEREKLLGDEGFLKRANRRHGIFGTVLMHAKGRNGKDRLLKNNGAMV